MGLANRLSSHLVLLPYVFLSNHDASVQKPCNTLVKVTVYVDTNTSEVGLEVGIFGITISSLHGNLKEGLVLHLDLIAVSGQVKLFGKKNGVKTEVWLAVDVTFALGIHAAVHEEKKLLTF